jgi:hypothetical protein
MNSKTLEHSVAKEQRFRQLAEIWKKDTLYLSSVAKKAMHPAYQGIIGLGETAVPWILEELKKEAGDWFWALTAITGENPVPEASAGKVPEMVAAWLHWGREQGYIQ